MQPSSTYSFSEPQCWINPIIQNDADVRGDQGSSIVIIDKTTPYLDTQSFVRLGTVCKTIWENQKSNIRDRKKHRPFSPRIQGLPDDLKAHVIAFSYSPSILKKGLQLHRSREQYLNTAFVTDEQRGQLDEAHQLTEKLYGLLEYSLISKKVYKGLTEQRNILSQRIVEIVTAIQDGDRGTKCLRECVDQGAYLKVFRVFFFYKPNALFNYATDERRNEGYNKTILHNAACPNNWRISVPFVAFIVEMDIKHQLGVTRHKNCYQETPLESTLKGSMPSTKVEIAARKTAQRMLFVENFVNNIIDTSLQQIAAPIEQTVTTPIVDPVPLSPAPAPELPPKQPTNSNSSSSLCLSLWNAISSFIAWVCRCFGFK